jgi:hypothetical protein
MPAYRSLINSLELVNAQGQDTANYYQSVADLMNQPNTILIPTLFSGGVGAVGEFLAVDWLNQAFDSYVLEDGDLQTELEDAQIKASAFQQCISALPPFDPAAGGQQDYFEQINTCAIQADPELEGIF